MERNTNKNNMHKNFEVGTEIVIIKDTNTNIRYRLTGLDTKCLRELYIVTKLYSSSEILKLFINFFILDHFFMWRVYKR